MITTMQMYWLTRLDGMCAILCLTSVLFLAALITLLCKGLALIFKSKQYSWEIDEDVKRARKLGVRLLWWAKISGAGFVVSALLNALTPNTRQMAAIIVVPKIANSEKVQEAGNKLYDLAVEWMEALKSETEGDAE